MNRHKALRVLQELMARLPLKATSTPTLRTTADNTMRMLFGAELWDAYETLLREIDLKEKRRRRRDRDRANYKARKEAA